VSPKARPPDRGAAVVHPRTVDWPVELGYDGEALCARCLRPLRGPDGLRLGGSGSVTTVEWFLRAVADHIEGCPDPGYEPEYHDHTPRAERTGSG